jgi:hypothetical protein
MSMSTKNCTSAWLEATQGIFGCISFVPLDDQSVTSVLEGAAAGKIRSTFER